jgi:hypothetical protein
MFQALFLPFASPVCDWECKGKKIYLFSKFRAKTFFKFFVSDFSNCPPPVEAGCKGTVSFPSSASGLKNYFFYLLHN